MSENNPSNKKEESGIKISPKPFFIAVGIILALIIISGILTKVIPTGHYDRIKMVNGEIQYVDNPEKSIEPLIESGKLQIIDDTQSSLQEIQESQNTTEAQTDTQKVMLSFLKQGRTIVIQNSYKETKGERLAVYRWFTSIFEVLWGENRVLLWIIILFMVFLGGSIRILERENVLETMMALTIQKFKHHKYGLMAVIMFTMMFLSSVVGIYEAMVPMIIFLVPLSLALGWDTMTGLGMSLLALAFGFAAAITNPFTIVIAQQLAEVVPYSGAWLRMIFFILIFAISYTYTSKYAKKVEANPTKSLTYHQDEKIRSHYTPEKITEDIKNSGNKGMKGAIIWFTSCLGVAILFIMVSAIVDAISSDIAFPLVSLMFLIGGIGAGIFLKMKPLELTKVFLEGSLALAPGIFLVMMAMAVSHIMVKGNVMDTILYNASELIKGTSPYKGAFLIYLLTLILNFFIGSASAKAFLIIPIITPLADIVGITRQTVVFAFDMGDGFSNMLFPTNPLLLLGLSLAGVGYTKWLKWTIPMQIIIFALSMSFLMFAVFINFS